MSDISLIERLQNPSLYNHPVIQFEVIETHLSWVLLTGWYAYKIKKPLNLGFNDFSTLEKRHYYCALELKLNKLLAPDLYLNLVAITIPQAAHLTQPDLSSIELIELIDITDNNNINNNIIIEYAVKLKQFDQHLLLSKLSQNAGLTYDIIDSLAKQCAEFHSKIPVCQPSHPYYAYYGSPKAILESIQANFFALQSKISLAPKLIEWVGLEYKKLTPLFEKRKKNNFIRACHGDIHLNNIVLLNHQALIFDCIEFNEAFRWIDVINDIAFLAMDLERIKQPRLAQYFVNRYCEYTGDYEGLLLLKFYKSYRAFVRCKIALFMKDNEQAQVFIEFANSYTDDYFDYRDNQNTKNTQPTLSITFGPSGVGKSHYTAHLDPIRLRSDVIRKQLMHLPAYEPTNPWQVETLYSPSMTYRLYHYLRDIAAMLLNNNISVIIDASCLKKWQRDLFYELAHHLKVPFTIFEFCIKPDILKQHIIERRQDADQSSDATLIILEEQLKNLEPLTESEKKYAKKIF